MRKIVAHLIVTLDGVVNFDAVVGEIVKLRDTEQVLSDFYARMAEEDAMLLGRVTYEQWSAYWPGSKNEPFASHINGVPKYVVSSSLSAVSWGTRGNASLLRGKLTDTVAELKRQPGATIGVHGSPTLVASLVDADLLDELRIELYPVIAGTGARLFGGERPPKRLELIRSRVTGNGVAILSYGRTAS